LDALSYCSYLAHRVCKTIFLKELGDLITTVAGDADGDEQSRIWEEGNDDEDDDEDEDDDDEDDEEDRYEDADDYEDEKHS
jgi:hypothetical protein